MKRLGVKLTDLLIRKKIQISDLSNKIIAVDASLWLYQFMSSIRQSDGTLLLDSQGRITSHLSGLFSRSASLMQQGVRLIYVFDGVPPLLKQKELMRRRELKKEAALRFEIAKEKEDIEGMKKYASRTTMLNSEMKDEAKKLLDALGIPHLTAISEGEAQAAFLVKNGDAYAVASQDADSLLFGALRLVRNLSLSGKKKMPGRISFMDIVPEIVNLEENLFSLGMTQDQLIALGLLIGTDFNPGGIPGIGPKNGLKLALKYKNNLQGLFSEVKWDEYFSVPWEDIFCIFSNMPVSKDYDIKWAEPNAKKVIELLCQEHDFSEERVKSTLSRIKINNKNDQHSLSRWF